MTQVPNKTSVYKIEPVQDPYTIAFAPELVPIIKSGEKVKTYRFGKKYDYLQIDDIVTIIDNLTKEIIGKAKITSKVEVKFTEIPLDIQGHETYKNKEQQKSVFNGYYAYIGRPIENEDLFLILQFELIKD